MRMHGFGLMSMVLTDLAEDTLLIAIALEAMNQWRLQEKNKVVDSGMEELVEGFVKNADARVSGAARQLLDYWATLEVSYRIARKPKIASLDEEDEATTTTIAEADSQPFTSATPDRRRPQAWENNVQVSFNAAPVRRGPPTPAFARPRPPPPPTPVQKQPSHSAVAEKSRLDAIIALAQQSVTAASSSPSSGQRGITHSPADGSSPRGSRASVSPAPPRPVEEIWAEEERRKEQEKERERRKRQRRQSENAEKDDKRAKKLMGDVVVHVMSKHKHKMEKEHFKHFAQECTELLVDKEKKGKDFAAFCRLKALPDEKRKKVKSFVEAFTTKVLKRLEAKGKLKVPANGTEGKSTDAKSNGDATHEPSATPGDSYTLATPDLIPQSTPLSQGDGSGTTPADNANGDSYGDSDLEMDIDIDAELGDHVFTVKERPTSF